MIRLHPVFFVMLLILTGNSWCHADLASESDPGTSIAASGGRTPEAAFETRAASITVIPCQTFSPDPVASQSIVATPSASVASQPTSEELRRDYPAGWLPVVEPAGEIFPSLVLALANVPKPPDQPAPEGATIICFLGFYLDDAWKTRAFLDESILGAAKPEQQRIMGALERTLPRQIARTDDWQSFKSAIRTGYEYYRDHLGKFGKGNPDYQGIDLGESRTSGIMPIARP